MDSNSSQLYRLGWAALLVLIVLVSYLPVVRCGFVWDDDTLLTNNLNVRSAAGVAHSWVDPTANEDYYPLIYTSWGVEYALWGRHALGYHVDNVILHALNALLLWLILRRLAVPGAWMAAAVWALHPVQVESVAWVAERKNALSGLFFFLSLWCFVRAWLTEGSPRGRVPAPGTATNGGTPAPDPGTRGRWGWFYALSLLFFVAAMFAKPVSMTLAGVLPVLVWWKRGRVGWRDVAALVPYLLLAVPMACLTIWVQRHNVGAMGTPFAYRPLERCLIAGRAVVFYLLTLFWPTHLAFAYPKWHISARQWWQYLYPTAVVAGLVLLWVGRRRLGRGPLAAALIYIIILAPALGFVSIYWHLFYFVADHIQYLASAAVLAAVVGGVAGLSRGRRVRPSGIAMGCGMVLVALGTMTWFQATTYHDGRTLWLATIQASPSSWLPYDALGENDLEAGRIQSAMDLYRQALDLEPSDANAWNGRGVARMRLGDKKGAMEDFLHAIRIFPRLARAHNNLGALLLDSGHLNEAIHELRAALACQSRNREFNAQVHFRLGVALSYAGDGREAMDQYQESIRLNPSDWEPHNALGALLAASGELRAAEAEFQAALHLGPRNPAVQQNLERLQAMMLDPGAATAPGGPPIPVPQTTPGG